MTEQGTSSPARASSPPQPKKGPIEVNVSLLDNTETIFDVEVS